MRVLKNKRNIIGEHLGKKLYEQSKDVRQGRGVFMYPHGLQSVEGQSGEGD